MILVSRAACGRARAEAKMAQHHLTHAAGRVCAVWLYGALQERGQGITARHVCPHMGPPVWQWPCMRQRPRPQCMRVHQQGPQSWRPGQHHHHQQLRQCLASWRQLIFSVGGCAAARTRACAWLSSLSAGAGAAEQRCSEVWGTMRPHHQAPAADGMLLISECSAEGVSGDCLDCCLSR